MPESFIVECPACGTANRLPESKPANGKIPVCGNCKQPLPQSVKPLIITDATFTTEIASSQLPVLLDMWAPWCGPCQMIAPVVDQLAAEMAGRLLVGKLNVDENPLTADRFQVRGIPCLLILKAGREVDRIVGAQPKSEIVRRVAQVLSGTSAKGGQV